MNTMNTMDKATQKLVTTITTILKEECTRPANMAYAKNNGGMFPAYIADDLISPMVSCCWELVMFKDKGDEIIVTVMHDDPVYGNTLNRIKLTK